MKDYPVNLMCKVLQVSVSAFYEDSKEPVRPRSRHRTNLTSIIEKIVMGSKRTYGIPRVHAVLQGMSVRCSKKTVAAILKENKWNAKTKRKFKVTTDSDHKMPIAENLLNRDFSPATANAVWAGDITYVRTTEGWLYLAVVMDLFSRKIVGWSMGRQMSRSLVIDAFRMAVMRRQPTRGLLFHSDKGSQYASADFRRVLWAAGARQSMSGTGACWDNAVVESFFKTLKTELVYQTTYATRQEAKLDIFSWIEVSYNKNRIHSTLGYKTPVDFEEVCMAQVA